MTVEQSLSAKACRRAATAAFLSILLASCTSASDPVSELSIAAQQEVAADKAADGKAADLSLAAEEERTAVREGEKAAGDPKAATTLKAEASQAPTEGTKTEDAVGKDAGAKVSDASESPQTAEAIEAKRRGFLSSFFSSAPQQNASAAIALKKATAEAEGGPAPEKAALQTDAKPPVDEDKEAKPLVKLASTEAGEHKVMTTELTSMDALPGVRSGDQLFEISRKSGMDSDVSDVDVYEDTTSYQVASAGGMARMGEHGLIRQRGDVQVGCLKPGLVNILHAVERHYGKKVMVTSGYRSPSHNKAVHGAKRSMHMYCAAADIKMDGVSKWELARYLRAMPGRGGVGTYCHTNAIHIDVGPERDWNWRCKRG